MFETLNSLLDNYKSKIKNPLIGTIISVWLIHNWRIVYAIFNFDDNCTMQDKINFIDDYFTKKDFWNELIIIVGISFLVIIITFILLGISRYVTNLYYKIIEPWIRGKVSKHEIFTVEAKKGLEQEIELLSESLDRKRDEINRVESNISLINAKRDFELKDYEDYRSATKEENKDLNEKLKEFSFKEKINRNIIIKFDEIIDNMAPVIRHDLIVYVEKKEGETKKQYKNFVGFRAELQKIGGFEFTGAEIKEKMMGTLFLMYFKDTTFNDPTKAW